jgi:hypothetical protein
MNSHVQFIVTPSGERLAVMPEQDYLMLAVSEDDVGDATPEFLEELGRRRQRMLEGGRAFPLTSCVESGFKGRRLLARAPHPVRHDNSNSSSLSAKASGAKGGTRRSGAP